MYSCEEFLFSTDLLNCIASDFIPEQFTAKVQEPLIPTLLYKIIAPMEAPSLIVSVTRYKTVKAVVKPFINVCMY